MGLRVVASDRDPQAPGFSLADAALTASTYDAQGTLAAVRQYLKTQGGVDGVICIATDVPYTVAYVADALGLPGIPLDAALLATDKLAMKDHFAKAGVPIPWYRSVSSAKELVEIADSKGCALVVKPVDSRGARGVLRLTGRVDLNWAYDYALSYSPKGRVIVEEYLSGPQISTESLVVNGRTYTPGFSDRNYEYLDKYTPHMIEDGGELPSFLDTDTQEAVRELVERAVASLNISNGTLKGDIVVHNGRPYIIEVATRLSGGYFCSHEIPMNTGVDFVGASIRLALGEPVPTADLRPKFVKQVVQRYIFPEPGTVTDIRGVDEVAARDNVLLCEVRVQPGDLIGPVDSHPARAGVVMTTGADRAEAIRNAEEAVRAIKVLTR